MKINTAYFIAKEELPFTNFLGLLQLQQNNGVKTSNTYANDTKCAEMVSTVATVIKKENAFERMPTGNVEKYDRRISQEGT